MAATSSPDLEKVSDDVHVLQSLPRVNTSSASLDKAFVYAQHAETAASGAHETETRLLLRKIDRRIVPIAFAAYFLQSIDKLNINYAAVMGLNKDLKLVGNDFNNANSAINIATLIAEVPTKGSSCEMVAKWLALNIVVWGISTACTAAVTNYHGLLACRILVGISEAATQPCLMMITSMWYTKSEAIFRFSIWYTGLGVAQVIGSLVSWGFQQVLHKSLSGWRIMFVMLGCLTVLAGLGTFFILPDSPMSSKWLTEDEKSKAIKRVERNQTGIKNPHFKFSQLLELVLDVQMWLIFTMVCLLSMTGVIISFYSTTLIRNFGFTPTQSALLNMPSGAVTLLTSIILGYVVSSQQHYRTIWIALLASLAALGSALMSFLPVYNRGGLLTGVYLQSVATVCLLMFFSLTTANISGHTKRSAATAVLAAASAIGSIAGPQLFKPQDAPQFIPAKISLLSSQLIGAFLAIVLLFYYRWQNHRRATLLARKKETGEYKEIANIAWLNLTDKENETFRYIY
ncbi:major facilitator superfamily domain-containing protein [Mycena crocata]|nr:major facilitator superfamily domain-containing protein [Mycena crocata]